MEFKEYSKAVMAWVDGVMQNRGADAEKTLKYCADIEQTDGGSKASEVCLLLCGRDLLCAQ